MIFDSKFGIVVGLGVLLLWNIDVQEVANYVGLNKK